MSNEYFRGGGGGGGRGGSGGRGGGGRGFSGHRGGNFRHGNLNRGRNWNGRWNNYWGGGWGGYGSNYYYPRNYYGYYEYPTYTTGYDVINVVDNNANVNANANQSCNRLEDKGTVYFCPSNATGFSKQGENWMCVCPTNQFIPTSSTCSNDIQKCA